MKTPLPSTLNVPLGSRIQCLSGHAGEFGQLGTKQHFLAAGTIIDFAMRTADAKRDALVRFVRNLARTSGTISRDEFAAIKKAGYTDVQFVEISLALAVAVFTNVFICINNATINFPAVEVVATA
jgi:alkylhydroperoxidase family enzyme